MIPMLYKDGIMLWKKGKMYLVFTVFFGIIGALNQENNVFFFYMLSALYLSMAPLTLLGLEEQMKWETYAAMLPLSKKAQVMEKYLLSALGLIVGIFINAAINRGMGKNMDGVMTCIPIILTAGLLFAAFELPLIYKMGVDKSKMGYIFLAALVIGAVAVAGKLTGENSETWNIVVAKETLWTGVLVSVWLFVISMVISMFLYEKKEF